MTESWIKIRGLCFHHGQQRVLSEVNLDFAPGRHYILAGANGAGKSTLMDILAGLRQPAAGELSLMGRPRASMTALEAARILALAPQDFRLNFTFSVRELVAMGRRPYLGRWGVLRNEDWAAVEEAIAEMDLESLAEKSVTALSGGEKQRCVVARALAQSCPILLLDEPSAGLDVAHALKLMDVAKRKAETGQLVITVSHDLNLAAAFGHEFVFLKRGELLAAGPTSEVFVAENLAAVYDAPCRVRQDDFAGGPAASFRLFGL